MLTWPETKLINAPGIKNGETLRGPFSFIKIAVSAIDCKPPIPDPIITPVRTKSSLSVGFHPLSSTACCAAAIPKIIKSSIFRCSFGDMYASALKVPSVPSPKGTSHAYFVTTSLALNFVIGPAPDCPSNSRSQVVSTPSARGDTIPSPVTTTRRILISNFDRYNAIREYQATEHPPRSQILVIKMKTASNLGCRFQRSFLEAQAASEICFTASPKV